MINKRDIRKVVKEYGPVKTGIWFSYNDYVSKRDLDFLSEWEDMVFIIIGKKRYRERIRKFEYKIMEMEEIFDGMVRNK